MRTRQSGRMAHDTPPLPAPPVRIRDDVPLEALDAGRWDALAGGGPLISHRFLAALHATGCASTRTGWTPRYLTAWAGEHLVGAMPLYEKAHSYGEYVFDWGWADAYRRYGRRYYPKLVCAIPFTPVPGPRLLGDRPAVKGALLDAALGIVADGDASSLHVLFIEGDDRAACDAPGHHRAHRRAVPLAQRRLSRLRRFPVALLARQAQEGEAGPAQGARDRRDVPPHHRPRHRRRATWRSSSAATRRPTARTDRRPTSPASSSSASPRRCRSTCCW